MTWTIRSGGGPRVCRGVGGMVAAALAALAVCACGPPALVPGQAVEGRLEPGRSAEYRIEAGAGEYLRVVVEPVGEDLHRGLDVRVTAGRAPLLEAMGVRDPAGGVLAWVSGGDEHRLELANSDSPAELGYRITLERRAAKADDRHRAAAENARAEAVRSLTSGSSALARQALVRELEHWRQVEGSAAAQAESLLDQVSLAQASDPDQALELCEAAIRLSAQESLPSWSMQALNWKGRLLRRRDCAGALDAYRQARQIALSADDLKWAGDITYNIGRLHDFCGSRQEAEAALDDAIDLGRRAGDPGLQAVGHRELAILARRTLDLDAAQEHLDQASELLETANDPEASADVLSERALLARSRGRLAEARDLLRRSLDLNQPVGREHLTIDVLLNLGAVSLDLRLPEDARGYFSQALDRATALGASAKVAEAQRELGAAAEQMGEEPRAEELYRRSLATAETLDPGPVRSGLAANAKFRLGNSLLLRGRPAEAVEPLAEAVALHAETGDRRAEAIARGALGTALSRAGETERAAAQLGEALAATRELGDPVAVAWSLHRQAEALAEADPERARHLLEEAIEGIERVRSGLGVDPLRAHFFEGPRRLWELYVDLLVATGAPRDAFAASERGRARALLDLLTEARVDLHQDLAPPLREEARRAEEQMHWLRSELAAAVGTAGSGERLAELRARLADAERDWWRVERTMREASPRYRRLQAPAIVGIEELQERLPPGRALLEYWLGRDRAYVFVVTRDRFKTVPLGDPSDLAARVGELRSAITGLLPPSRLAGPAHALYRDVLAPALAVAGELDELVVVPDGPLHLVPFEVLVTSAPGSARSFGELDFLVRRVAISYAPSATVLTHLEIDREGAKTASSAAPPRLVAFADPTLDRPPVLDCGPIAPPPDGTGESSVRRGFDPLTGARDEASAIATALGDRTVVFAGAEASEVRVKRDPEVAAAERLHFAVHGLACETFPERSGLVLAAGEDSDEDGFLQAREIFGLRLAADLVVLSACDSGSGKLLSGEGVIGLTRAFFYAGAPTAVVSLWPVSDRSTAELMKTFYTALDHGDDKAVALQQARLRLIDRGGRYAAPFYWAPFVLLGSREGGAAE